ncbi:MAG: aminotransferase class IV, partial [Bacteroidota bacterium]
MILWNHTWISDPAQYESVLNRAFRYGDGLFETMRVYKGRLLFAKDHQARLQRGMDTLGFYLTGGQNAADLWPLLESAVEQLKLAPHGRLRIQFFRGGAGAYTPLQDQAEWIVEGQALKNDSYAAELSWTLTVSPDTPLFMGPLSGLKTCSALPYVLAGRHARKMGFDEALLLCDGHVSEASAANVFMVQQQKIFTPPLESACLDGVMRKQIFALAEELKIPLVEKKLKVKDFHQADEIF